MDPARKSLDKPAGHFHCQTRFTDTARTGDRNQAHILPQQQFFSGGGFPFSPHKPGSRHGEIARARLHLLSGGPTASPSSGFPVWLLLLLDLTDPSMPRISIPPPPLQI